LKLLNKILIFSFTIIIVSNLVAKENVVVLSNINKVQRIGNKISIYKDTTNNLNLNEIIAKDFIKSDKIVPNLGISNYTFWVKIEIKNESKDSHFILNVDYPTLDNICFYFPNKSNKHYDSLTMGEKYPFSHRIYDDPDYLFEIILNKRETKTYYLKISSKETIQLPIRIGNVTQIYNQLNNKNILSGLYFGLMLVMILYNLFIYFTVKDKSYIFYVIYIALILITQSILQGFTFKFLWPNFPKFAQYNLFIFPSLVGLASLLFMNIFLKLKLNNNIMYKISMVFILPYSTSMILALFQQFKLSYIIMEATAMIVSIFMLYTVFLSMKKGFPPAKYFLIAWSIFLIGVIIYILKEFEILPYNNFTRYTMQIGSAIETVLLSFALASRINLYKKERLMALQENEKLVREQNIILEQKVTERTNSLNETLIHLKNTQAKLVDAEKMSSLGQLTAGIAHEINNPINFVSSNIPPLKQDLEDLNTLIHKYEEVKTTKNLTNTLKEIDALKKELDFDYLQKELKTIIAGIEDGAKRTTSIVSGLRNFSRLDKEDKKLADINEGILSTLLLIKRKFKNITLAKDLQPLPKIECFPGKLNQLFMNIIDNAIGAINAKKSTDGAIRMATFIKNNHVYITIEDNGIGMDENTHQNRI